MSKWAGPHNPLNGTTENENPHSNSIAPDTLQSTEGKDPDNNKVRCSPSPDSAIGLCDEDDETCNDTSSATNHEKDQPRNSQNPCTESLFYQYNTLDARKLSLLKSLSQDSEYSLDTSFFNAEEFLEDLGFAGSAYPTIPDRFMPSLIQRISKFPENAMESLNDRILLSIGRFKRRVGKRKLFRNLSMGKDTSQQSRNCHLCPTSPQSGDSCDGYPLMRSNTGPARFSEERLPSLQVTDAVDSSVTHNNSVDSTTEGNNSQIMCESPVAICISDASDVSSRLILSNGKSNSISDKSQSTTADSHSKSSSGNAQVRDKADSKTEPIEIRTDSFSISSFPDANSSLQTFSKESQTKDVSGKKDSNLSTDTEDEVFVAIHTKSLEENVYESSPSQNASKEHSVAENKSAKCLDNNSTEISSSEACASQLYTHFERGDVPKISKTVVHDSNHSTFVKSPSRRISVAQKPELVTKHADSPVVLSSPGENVIETSHSNQFTVPSNKINPLDTCKKVSHSPNASRIRKVPLRRISVAQHQQTTFTFPQNHTFNQNKTLSGEISSQNSKLNSSLLEESTQEGKFSLRSQLTNSDTENLNSANVSKSDYAHLSPSKPTSSETVISSDFLHSVNEHKYTKSDSLTSFMSSMLHDSEAPSTSQYLNSQIPDISDSKLHAKVTKESISENAHDFPEIAPFTFEEIGFRSTPKSDKIHKIGLDVQVSCHMESGEFIYGSATGGTLPTEFKENYVEEHNTSTDKIHSDKGESVKQDGQNRVSQRKRPRLRRMSTSLELPEFVVVDYNETESDAKTEQDVLDSQNMTLKQTFHFVAPDVNNIRPSKQSAPSWDIRSAPCSPFLQRMIPDHFSDCCRAVSYESLVQDADASYSYSRKDNFSNNYVMKHKKRQSRCNNLAINEAIPRYEIRNVKQNSKCDKVISDSSCRKCLDSKFSNTASTYESDYFSNYNLVAKLSHEPKQISETSAIPDFQNPDYNASRTKSTWNGRRNTLTRSSQISPTSSFTKPLPTFTMPISPPDTTNDFFPSRTSFYKTKDFNDVRNFSDGVESFPSSSAGTRFHANPAVISFACSEANADQEKHFRQRLHGCRSTHEDAHCPNFENLNLRDDVFKAENFSSSMRDLAGPNSSDLLDHNCDFRNGPERSIPKNRVNKFYSGAQNFCADDCELSHQKTNRIQPDTRYIKTKQHFEQSISDNKYCGWTARDKGVRVKPFRANLSIRSKSYEQLRDMFDSKGTTDETAYLCQNSPFRISRVKNTFWNRDTHGDQENVMHCNGKATASWTREAHMEKNVMKCNGKAIASCNRDSPMEEENVRQCNGEDIASWNRGAHIVKDNIMRCNATKLETKERSPSETSRNAEFCSSEDERHYRTHLAGKVTDSGEHSSQLNPIVQNVCSLHVDRENKDVAKAEKTPKRSSQNIKREAMLEKKMRIFSKLLSNLGSVFLFPEAEDPNTTRGDKNIEDKGPNQPESMDDPNAIDKRTCVADSDSKIRKTIATEALLCLLKLADLKKIIECRSDNVDMSDSVTCSTLDGMHTSRVRVTPRSYGNGIYMMVNIDDKEKEHVITMYHTSVSMDVNPEERCDVAESDRKFKNQHEVPRNHQRNKFEEIAQCYRFLPENPYKGASKELEELQLAIQKAKETRISASRELHLLQELLLGDDTSPKKEHETSKSNEKFSDSQISSKCTTQDLNLKADEILKCQALSDLREKSKREILEDTEFFQDEIKKVKQENDEEWQERLSRMEMRLKHQEQELTRVQDENRKLKRHVELGRLGSPTCELKSGVYQNGYALTNGISDTDDEHTSSKPSSPTMRQDCDRLQEHLMKAEQRADELNILLNQKLIELNKLQLTLSKQTKEMIELEKSYIQLQCRLRRGMNKPSLSRLCSRSLASKTFIPRSSPPNSPRPGI